MKLELDLLPFSKWCKDFCKPLMIVGPCSAESEEQMLSTAREIAINYPHAIFRAGIWKPRTRPNTFEGIGDIGLEWMQLVKKETGLQTATEVATAEHVEKCLKAGVDILWVGARTTVNPFSVQAIADALKGVNIPVFVKNPIYPDIQLWAGALERINNAGIKKLAAIHRGFHSYDNGPFRNSPKWELAIDLKTACPELPLICDPSHIGGSPELIPYLAQKAMDMDMDGLMIETHINPKVALSDAKQQITPSELKEVISHLHIRNASIDNLELQSKLDELRGVIAKLDNELLELLAKRMTVSMQIGEHKKANNITILQVAHWKKLIEESVENAEALGLPPDFIRGLYRLIHDESIRRQTEVMNK
ncbi:MAG: bifunctional 3-deoxy-7-phosphoheptulonate synthase/chorismate mutase type II [Bacteroidota bacterium]|nr:bifunctional 3-deoxy-7-phosphoheptulonate synthase/chorismate mutase type II [Bacteroidota bacterium]